MYIETLTDICSNLATALGLYKDPKRSSFISNLEVSIRAAVANEKDIEEIKNKLVIK